MQEPVLEGIDQDIFHMEYPRECIESVLLLGHMMFDCEVFQWKIEEYPRKIQAFLSNTEAMLGTRKGELKYFIQMFGQIS